MKVENLNKALDHLSEQVKIYRQTPVSDCDALCEILQQLTATVHYLESHRVHFHDQFNTKINRLVLQGESVARSENQAKVDHPEYYRLRRIMESTYKVIEAIRTQISYFKTEKQNA
jgi:hypothetical protein